MLSEYFDFLLQKVSASFLCGAGGMTVFAVVGGIDWLITRSWMEFKAKQLRERRYMRGVVIRSYRGIHGIELADDLVVPSVRNRDEVLIKVMAAGADPVDLKISSGYGRSIRSHLQQYCKGNEFPITLGRDCSGIVIDTGSDVRSVAKGDHVWAVSSCYEEGLMMEYVVVKESQVSMMPKKMSFKEAASVPYVGIVTMNSLINQANLGPQCTAGKRILVYASNTSYGLLAIQLLKAWGGHVTAVVPTTGLPMCRILNSDDVIVYSVTDFQEELKNRKKFDIILNYVGTFLHRFSVDMCTHGGRVITMSTCPSITDKYGLWIGFFVALAARISIWVRKFQVFFGIPYGVSFGNIPVNSEALNSVTEVFESHQIHPVYEDFPLQDALEAFRQIGSYSAVGRAVVSFDTGNENGYITA